MKRKKKLSKGQMAAIIAVAAAAVLLILTAVLVPVIKVNNGFDEIVEEMLRTPDPSIMITDMSAENVFGDTSGEITLVSPDLVKSLADICDDMKYNVFASEPFGVGLSGIRFRVKTENGVADLYLTKDSIYYTEGGKISFFVPKNDDAEKSYTEFYENIKKLIE